MEGLFGTILESRKKYPDKPFVKSADRTWTYNEVYSMALNVCEYLRGCGVEKGEPVIIFCDNSIQYIAAFFGVLRLNAVAVPVNPAKMTESLLYIIEKCSPRLVLACDSTTGRLSKLGSSLFAEVVNIDQCYLLQDPDPENVPVSTVDENDPAVILFTSGTTAMPKGVTLTHGNLLANTLAIVEYLHLSCGDSILMTLPFTYSYGNSVLLTHAYSGATIILENITTYPYKILEGIKKYNVTGFSTVGSYINLMLKCLKNTVADKDFLAGLKYMTFAGESTNLDDIRYINKNYPDMKVYVMYGQTEASARLSYLSPDLLQCKSGSIGKGLCNVDLKVVDEYGGDIKPGEIGEIIARGPSIMKGYWKDPAATEEVLKNGWLHTGDNATVDEDGYIYIKGRKSDMIKHMGHRISPVEIENILNGCKYVRESAVIESILEDLPVIKAFIVPEEGFQLEEIKKDAASRLPIYMRPQVYEVIGYLPRTDSGKIMRSALRRNK